MTAEILKFPHNNKDVILSLMETAKLLEKTSPEQCISIQRDVITRALTARAVFNAFRTVPEED